MTVFSTVVNAVMSRSANAHATPTVAINPIAND